MSMTEHQLISKVLDENNLLELNKYNIKETDFHSLPDAYQFIKSYHVENGRTPDYRTVVSEYSDFEYMPEVTDSFKYLAKKLKGDTAKRRAVGLLQDEASANFSKMSGIEFANWLHEEATLLKDLAQSESYTGSNYATTGDERWERYQENKESRTYRYIKTPFPSLTEYLGGGFELGDYVLTQAYTNRGKSWLASLFGATAWLEKHGVIHYSPELSLSQQEQRNDTLIGHFNNTKLKMGEVSDDKYRAFLDGFDLNNETPYLIKTMEHLPKGLSLDVIEADLQANPEIGMVIIDGFTLMDHKGRGSNRDNMSTTSRRLRQIFGRYQVAGIVVHQTPTSAEKENKGDDETGARVVQPPEIDQYSETIAVIQDASAVLNYDYHDGLAKLKLAKARTPHVGKSITLHADYNHGYITEHTPMDEF